MQPHEPVTIGRDPATNKPVRILDTDRQRGIYILGIGGAGKTSLLLNLIDYDIRCGHGLFFLDPHGDALARIRANPAYADRLARDEILLDPTVETGSFGINLLACRNPAHIGARNTAYNRAYRVFERLFSKEEGIGTWGVWLQEMLQYTLLAFIENQDYTLADVPEFLNDPAFRNHIVNNIRHNQRVARFWQHDFGALPYQDQAVHAQALRTRVNILLNEYVCHIVGQKQTTIDFSECISRKAIILVSLPLSLSPDVKRTIGVLLLSELLHAVEARQYLTTSQRKHFGIYVDEVQNFAQSDDFSFLFTQARKFGIATTIAHQERFGQFADNKKMAGATAAAANVICFQLSPLDVPDLGRLFAEAPPTEVRREQELVISQTPIADLLRGHPNPEINAFAQKQLRQLHEGRADAREDMEGERLIRMDLMDEAMLYRLEDQIAGLEQTRPALARRHDALSGAEAALQAARGQTDKMLSHYDRARRYRESLRYLDRFFVAVMEGRVTPGTEAFSQLIISIVTASHIPAQYAVTLGMYVELLYGDPHQPLEIPLALAQSYDLASSHLTAAITAAEATFAQEYADRLAEHRAIAVRDIQKAVEKREFKKRHRELSAWLQLCGRVSSWGDKHGGWKVDIHNSPFADPSRLDHFEFLVRRFVPFLALSRIRDALRPYTAARLATPWREAFPPMERYFIPLFERLEEQLRISRQLQARRWFARQPPEGAHGTHFATFVLERFRQFLTDHGEGALVILLLLQTAPSPKGFMYDLIPLHRDFRLEPWMDPRFGDGYGRFQLYNGEIYSRYVTMLHMPAIVHREPLTIFLLTQRLARILSRANMRADYAQYYWRWDGRDSYTNVGWNLPYPTQCILACPEGEPEAVLKRLQDAEDMQLLSKLVSRLSASQNDMLYRPVSKALDEDKPLIWTYLRCRACDIVRYGERVANLTFPQPTLASAGADEVAETVSGLVSLMQEEELANEREADRKAEEAIEHTAKFYVNLADRFAERAWGWQVWKPPVPTYLPARVLAEEERQTIINACRTELLRGHEEGWNATATLNGIDELVHFCGLLSQPDNHVKVRSAKWVETIVNTRSEQDMAKEMERKLQDLNTQTAYARVHAESDGGSRVIKRLIKPPALLPVPEEAHPSAQLRLPPGVYKDRTLIEEEIRQRQARWRGEKHVGGHSKKPPPTSH